MCNVLDHLFILGTLGRAQKVIRLVALRVSPTMVDNDSTNFLETLSLCRVCLCKYMLPFYPLHTLRRRFVPGQVGFANGSPSGSWSKILSGKPIWKCGSSSSDVASEGPNSTDQGEVIHETPRCRSMHLRDIGSLRKPLNKACFWDRIEAPLPPFRPPPKCDFIHPRQLNPFPERLVLPFSIEVILSGYEELDSSGNDLFYFMGQTERTQNPGRTQGGH